MRKYYVSTDCIHMYVRTWMYNNVCRYYAVEFNTELHAVSIRQKQLLRQTRQWGESRLAVEGQSHDMHMHTGTSWKIWIFC